MLRLISILAVSLSLFVAVPAHATGRLDGEKENPGFESCVHGPDGSLSGYCQQSRAHAKKDHNTELLLISAGVGVVFVGAMWYFFHKSPSDNNPGQVKLAAF